jgi:sugar-specific transcriptional regulator TrmB
MQSDLIKKLKELDFKEYEAKVLLVMLSGSIMSASDIAKKSGIIRNSIYDVLKTFVERGYCNEIETNTILQYQIIDPEIIFDKIEKDQDEEHKKKLSALNHTLKDLKSIYKNKKIEDDKSINIEIIKGFNKHRVAKYIELLKKAKKEILGIYSLRGLVSAELDTTITKLIKKGGKVRSIYSSSLDFKVMKNGNPQPAEKDDLMKVCKAFQKNGEDLRLCELQIPNMTIFDKEKVFFNLGDKTIPVQSRSDLIVSYTEYAGYMEDLFNYYWERSMTIEEFKEQKNL